MFQTQVGNAGTVTVQRSEFFKLRKLCHTGIADLRFREDKPLRSFEQNQEVYQMFSRQIWALARNDMLCIEVAHSRTERLQRMGRSLSSRTYWLYHKDLNRDESGRVQAIAEC